ncbi:MAG: hypothetical protein WED10_06645 [Brumimicrobium sp.]
MLLEVKEVIAKTTVPAADICICSDGIMRIHIKVKNTFEISDSMQIVEARTKLAKGNKYPVLYTTESSFVTPSKEVSNYVASEGRSELVVADAFVVKSIPQRLAAKTYYLFKKPVRPTAFFSNEKEALKWLNKFL